MLLEEGIVLLEEGIVGKSLRLAGVVALLIRMGSWRSFC